MQQSKQIVHKFFNLAEGPIRHYLSKFLGISLKDLFEDDIADGFDHVAVTAGKKTFYFYLEEGDEYDSGNDSKKAINDNVEVNSDENKQKNNEPVKNLTESFAKLNYLSHKFEMTRQALMCEEKFKQSSSLLYDAVHFTYLPIRKSIVAKYSMIKMNVVKDGDIKEELMPLNYVCLSFDQTKMRYSICAANPHAKELEVLNGQLKKLRDDLPKIDDKNQYIKVMNQLYAKIDEAKKAYNECERLSAIFKEKYPPKSYLYMVATMVNPDKDYMFKKMNYIEQRFVDADNDRDDEDEDSGEDISDKEDDKDSDKEDDNCNNNCDDCWDNNNE